MNKDIKNLQDNVERSIVLLGNGLLEHPRNLDFRNSVWENHEKREEFYKQLLVITYRFFYLILVSSNKICFPITILKQLLWWLKQCGDSQEQKKDALWREYISLAKNIRESNEKIFLSHSYLWNSFFCTEIELLECSNYCFFLFIQTLKREFDEKTISLEDLGELHQYLLERVPCIEYSNSTFYLHTNKANNRTSSGAYYTPIGLVSRVLASTLEPIIQRCLQKETIQEQEEALLRIRICDPSCGTGNFLFAAARYLSRQLSKVRSSKEPIIELQEVLENCIYGVDINPLSIDLCRISLAMIVGGTKQNVLKWEAHIQSGNALLGLCLDQMKSGIAPKNFSLVKGKDNPTVRNRILANIRLDAKERKKHNIASEREDFDKLSPSQQIRWADIVLASFVWPKIEIGQWEKYAPNNSDFENWKKKDFKNLFSLVDELKSKFSFFHWELSFPEVFFQGGFDVVIGNPPYLDSEYLKKNHPYQRSAIQNLYESAKGNWDIFIPFTELGLRIVKPNGYHAYVTPSKIIGADYAQSLHRSCFFRYRLREIHDYSRISLFSDARVSVVVVVTEKEKPRETDSVNFFQYSNNEFTPTITKSESIAHVKKLPLGYLSLPLAERGNIFFQWIRTHTTLSSIATVSDGATTSEAYEIQKIVKEGCLEDKKNTEMIALINTGTIDPFHLLWGKKTISYLGFDGVFPVIHAVELRQISQNRYQQAQRDKIVMAGLSTKLEAVVAPKGVLCGKAAVLIQVNEGICPYSLTVLLNSQHYFELYKGIFSMRGMSGRSLNIGPRQIERLPIPDIRFLKKTETNHKIDILQQNVLQHEGLLSNLGKKLHAEPRLFEDKSWKKFVEDSVLACINT